jgi:PAS domain S-box-containing protein
METSGNYQHSVTSAAVPPDSLLGAVLDLTDDAVFTCDPEGRVSLWCATAERLFGHPAEAVFGGPFDVLFPEHLSEEVRAVFATVMAGERIRHFETEVLRPDGMPLPVSLSLCPILNEAGAPVGSVIIARDVTEQHLAQATLAEIDARMAEGEALAHIGSWLWDLRTGVIQWSYEFHRIHCVDPLDFDGTLESYLALIHPDDRDMVRAAMFESVESGKPFDLDYRVENATRALHVVQVRGQPTYGSAATPVGLRGIGQDVSERGAQGAPIRLDGPGS